MAVQDLPDKVISHSPSDDTPGKVGFAQRAKKSFGTMSQRIGSGVEELASLTSQRIDSGVKGLANLVKLEVVVTIACFFIPLIVLYGDDWNLREHISGYYAMKKAQYFYFPLTVAAMLFVVNGVVKEKHWYNVGLGLALAGVIFFNHHDHSLMHNISAGAFFIGNALVFVIYTPKKELWFKAVLSCAVIVGMAGYFLFAWYSLFIAETLSLWVIAIHFILEAKGLIK